MRIVVAGYVAGFPVAGFLWHPLQFALGFAALGHDVWFLDDSGDEPWGYDPETGGEDWRCAAGARFLRRELGAVGLGDRWVFRHAPTNTFHGMDEATTRDVLADADVFVNVSLTTPLRPGYARIPHRFAIDTDPVFTQVRIAKGDRRLAPVPETHTRLFTFGRPPLPAQRHDWVPIRQPTSTRHWPVAPPVAPGAPFTTVTTWQAYPPVEWEGVEYGAKDRTLRAFADLPQRTAVPLSLALGAGPDQADAVAFLAAYGWGITDAVDATRTSASYRDFIAASAGEIGVAKHAYVASRSGWFSERTCCWLASGRPAVVQDTGWTEYLPAGEGLLAYTTADEAARALEAVAADPERHAAAARLIAEEHFEAETVCWVILEDGL
jgi:hypothetical protein